MLLQSGVMASLTALLVATSSSSSSFLTSLGTTLVIFLFYVSTCSQRFATAIDHALDDCFILVALVSFLLPLAVVAVAIPPIAALVNAIHVRVLANAILLAVPILLLL